MFLPMTADHGSEQGFHGLLRSRRLAAGLTQAELATGAGIGVRTVRDLERGRASRPQRTTVELLASALGLTGDDRAAFVAAARRQAASGESGPRRVIGLPPSGPLIGRDRDVDEVTALLLGGEPVVSLVGLAGVGKTSLALAVTDRLAEHHPGGVAGIVVTDGATESDVLTAVAMVLRVARPADLADRLDGGPTLLLVDAVERSPGAVAEALHQLTDMAPALRVLATGRHPVGVPGERVFPVAPLDVPPADAPTELDVVARYPAAALFIDRLRLVRREPLDAGEVGALVDLVRRLGGLPLALSIAAARGRVLDLNELLDRYGDRVLDLVGPQARGVSHQAVTVSLRDAVAASYSLLEPEERLALRRLSVFRNRWSVELAEEMLADGGATDPVPLLDRLAALGLVSVRASGWFRFRMLDVVRDYAAERAAAHDELGAIRRRHALVFARLAGHIAPELAGANFTTAIERLDHVASDLWGALAHSATDDPHTALRLASLLPRWWRFRGRDAAGRQWLRRLLDDPRTADADPAVRAWAKLGVAQLAAEHGAGPSELPSAEAALDGFQALGDVVGELAARTQLTALWMSIGGYDEARRHGAAALALATRTGRTRDMAVAQNNLTWHEIRTGDLVAARRRLAAVDRLAAQCGEDRLRSLARANLAEVARLDRRYADAVTLGRRAIVALERLGDPGHRSRVLGTVGLALAQDGRAEEATEVLAQLRLLSPTDGTEAPDVDGPAAAIEAALAMGRGDRDMAAEWYGVAAQAYAGGRDLRDVAEALVGLAAALDDPSARAAVVDRLGEVCKEGGITLLPGERAIVA